MRYGILAHNLGKTDCAELARRVSSYGLEFVQLALAKALTDFDSSLGKLNPGMAHYVADCFAKEGVRIGVLGRYINPIHPNPELRREQIDRFKEHLRFARDFGTSLVATETGSVQAYLEAYPDSTEEDRWSLLRSAVKEMVEEAEHWGVYAVIEASQNEVVRTPEQMKRSLEEVPSSHFGVLMDPVNLLNAANHDRQHEIVKRAFELWGDRIVLAHIKDFDITPDGKMKYVPMGTGRLDVPFFLDLLKQYKPYTNISFEGGITPDEVPAALEYVKRFS
ncbi:sugar phosphate isomerase/epimerase [Paenibacillus sp. P26]|nr:sugar phosphate isomerase/epimerase [Paenibacillus sp. P26]